jgi:hypothetical protein
VFLMIDKRDEYQLCQFIMEFKGSQFFSMGFVPLVYGAFLYYLCANHGHDCGTMGPSLRPWEIAVYLVQVTLVWAAFALLPYSLKKGTLRHRRPLPGEVEPPGVPGCCCGAERHPGRGGRLAAWVVYDLALFVVACTLIAVSVTYDDASWALFTGAGPTGWLAAGNAATAANVFWSRTLAGLLAFPFLLFRAPLMFKLLTHAPRTGYNRNGTCVPYLSNEHRRAIAAGTEVYDTRDEMHTAV